ncbi:MAG: arginine--tRNA ligase [Alphaproteobacteria bacterium]|nr:arginine--tRNA ligase [Alphaproteobacteria bacterium]
MKEIKMTVSIEKTINQKLETIFNKLDLDVRFALVKTSDRPDLSDFQCNGALALAKQLKKNPREIASDIANELQTDSAIESVSVDGPGFINIKLQNGFIADKIDELANDDRLGCAKTKTPKKVVMDFGGPNVAKALHVGHLRSAVIGESIRRIEKFIGNDVISDVHFGDWGTPMGMILAEIINKDGDLSKTENYDIAQISAIYKQANIRCKEDETAKETARQITAELQNGNPEYTKAWKHLRKVSVDDVKKNYDTLDAHFDLWLGESDAHQASAEVVKIAHENGLSEVDDNATIIRLPETNKPMPPVILVKSDKGFGYQVTDIATIKMRYDDLNADEIIYIVDKRQALHFEQVFQVADMLKLAPSTTLRHIGFGTVNGADGKPFKTRDGGVMNLEDLINMSKDKVRQSMPKANEVEGYGEKEIETLVSQIAMAAIKFQDLKNSIASGYVFDLEDFAKFDGKTGPYIQYAIARINSILRKAKANNLEQGSVIISNDDERNLALKLAQVENIITRAYNDKEPSIIADYAYTLAQTFSSFYNACPIMTASDKSLAQSRLKLAFLVCKTLKLMLNLLGIEAPEKMLKAA